MNVEIPNDFSGEVPGRKCEGNFPNWKVSESVKNRNSSSLDIENDTRCDDCLLQEVCTRYAVDSFLGNPLPPKKDFNRVSKKVYRDKILQDPDSDITALRECNGNYPWDKWKEWRIEGTDNFSVADPCASCIFVASCSSQAARILNLIPGESVIEDDVFDMYSRQRGLMYPDTTKY